MAGLWIMNLFYFSRKFLRISLSLILCCVYKYVFIAVYESNWWWWWWLNLKQILNEEYQQKYNLEKAQVFNIDGEQVYRYESSKIHHSFSKIIHVRKWNNYWPDLDWRQRQSSWLRGPLNASCKSEIQKQKQEKFVTENC